MSSEKCIMCKSEIDDPYQFGEKITVGNVTAHHLCLVRFLFVTLKCDFS